MTSAQDTALSIMEVNMHMYQTFPTLYAKDTNGKIKSWSAAVLQNSNYQAAIARLVHGYTDGKQQISYRDYNHGKNIGKKNETTPLLQCINETRRKWLDKKEKEGYTEVIIDTGSGDTDDMVSMIVLPMLAQTYNPDSLVAKKNTIRFPCFAQPKLDGLRCVTYLSKTGTIIHQSRTGATFEGLGHITRSVIEYLSTHPYIILDGELYTDEMPFEELVGLVKKKKMNDEDIIRIQKVKYHIYDIIDRSRVDLTYSERLRGCVDAVNGCNNYDHGGNSSVVIVQTVEVSDIPDFRNWFAKFVEQGYEGIMLRNKSGIYRMNYRSNDLQKYKEFMEDEYIITGFTDGEGRDSGAVVWICETPDGKEFGVRPRGTMEQRKEWFKTGDMYIGKKITVIYQELTEDGKPRFPIGKSIREEF
jgi:ATP-dependent DNA ligase